MDTHLIILFLAFIGLFDVIYLAIQRSKKRPPICIIGTSCEVVWESPHSKIFGIGNEIFGLVFYSAMIVIESIFLVSTPSSLFEKAELALLFVGTIMSCYYMFLQCYVIRAWCIWCTLSALLVLVMVIVKFYF